MRPKYSSRVDVIDASSFARRPARRVGHALLSLLMLMVARVTLANAQDPAARATLASQTEGLPLISISDNRRSAGVLKDGVLTLRLEARNGV